MMLDFEELPSTREVFVQIDQLEDRTRRGIRQWFFKLGRDLKRDSNKQILAKPRRGRVYKVKGPSGRRRRHVASLAGESPANRTGTYRKSIGFQIRGISEMLFGAEAPFAGFLENGTPKMAARPGLGNSVQALERNSLRDASVLVEREITKR